MIYLFCNERYGKRFLETARQFSREHGARIAIVFSDKTRSSRRRTLFSKVSLVIKDTVERSRFAYGKGVPLVIAENVNAPKFAKRIHPSDHGIVAGFNQIFREDTIRRFASLVNFHPSILPFYRGPVPSYWCIKNSEATTGFTLHTVTGKIDEGEVLTQGIVSIGSIRDADILDQEIADNAMETFRAYLRHLQTGEEMKRSKVDPKAVYKEHVDYASFPR
jgi:methionyl-tRNA formyltransferase